MIYVRAPVAAGTFYDLEVERLKKQIDGCFRQPLGPKVLEKDDKKVKAVVAPHAGYMYSGAVQAWAVSRLPKANYIIVGTNHSGFGEQFAVMRSGMWKTPLGGVVVDEKMAERMMKRDVIRQDAVPHESEHSVEVQLPFLQYRFGDFKFVPICVLNGMPDDAFLEDCRLAGLEIANAVKESKEKWILIASSDFTHYAPAEYAERTDKKLIAPVLKLDGKQFFSKVGEMHASVCGYGAIAVVMAAAKAMGAKKGELLKYATSGDTTGDNSSVVGYASVAIV